MTARLRWEHVITDAGHHLRLVGANNEIVLTSEVYQDADEVTNALQLVRKVTNTFYAHQPRMVDERTETMEGGS